MMTQPDDKTKAQAQSSAPRYVPLRFWPKEEWEKESAHLAPLSRDDSERCASANAAGNRRD